MIHIHISNSVSRSSWTQQAYCTFIKVSNELR